MRGSAYTPTFGRYDLPHPGPLPEGRGRIAGGVMPLRPGRSQVLAGALEVLTP
jgi:hypothetical protein